jgi:hypothetical protein
MSPASKLATLIPGTEAPGSKDRQVLPFVGGLLSRWGARYVDGRSAQPSSHVSDTRTARECESTLRKQIYGVEGLSP